MIADITSDLKVDSAITLSKAKAGCMLRICKLEGSECRRLREIGFCEEMQLCKLSNGRNMICAMCGTKLAVSRKLGDQVLVEIV
jgi:ferrous iron transport protein A